MHSNFVGPVNLGNPVELSIKHLANKIIKLTNSSSDIIYKELPEDDPKRRKPDISLALKNLNWSPKYGLDEGLIFTIKYFKKFL
jgi:UDP-glucuronate decarboxylase